MRWASLIKHEQCKSLINLLYLTNCGDLLTRGLLNNFDRRSSSSGARSACPLGGVRVRDDVMREKLTALRRAKMAAAVA